MPIFDLRITFDAPLHSGATAQRADSPGIGVAPITRDPKGRVCIRAATLKGIHRAATEQVALSLNLMACDSTVPQHMCQPAGKQSFCPICRTFGSPWLPGKVYYRDLTVTTTRLNRDDGESRSRSTLLSLKRYPPGRYSPDKSTI
jgi:CRISPR/Cas system CSM-associated protein Csm3 (group 7 of RAMP superfamily)